jgi:alkaline phosphatase D
MKHHFKILLGFMWLFAAHLRAQTLPPNMVADTAHAPFLHGVASFDPTVDHVLLWTKVDPGASSAPITLNWEVFSDASLNNLVSSGTAIADQPTDWTARVDALLPLPGRFYWYRWSDGQGRTSVVGRTKTAPTGAVAQVRLAVMSCSSIFSGYFNAYRRVGERDDIDLVVHLGDYIYDFVDQDEQVRVPVPAPIDPQTLGEWRERHAYYLLDPDLRLARQMHPWAVTWDNHDTDGDTPQFEADSKQAFLEYVPMRLQNPARPDLIYRRLAYGDLLDILVLDATTLRDRDTLPNGEYSMIGDSQWSWLAQEIDGSSARWRALAQERMMGRFSTAGLGSLINFGDGPVADSGAWDGYNGERVRLLSHLDQNGIDNNVVLSGDIHTSFACDLPIDYNNYNSSTGAGSAAVEFLPTSITRGNFDEAGITGFLAQLVAGAISAANPHHVYSELTSHGYGILDIRPDTVTAEFWYSPILQVAATESFATGYRCIAGENHWQRSAISNPTTVIVGLAEEASTFPVAIQVFPNPAGAACTVTLTAQQPQTVRVELLDLVSGRVLETRDLQVLARAATTTVWNLDGLPSGNYGLRMQTKDHQQTIRLQHIGR